MESRPLGSPATGFPLKCTRVGCKWTSYVHGLHQGAQEEAKRILKLHDKLCGKPRFSAPEDFSGSVHNTRESLQEGSRTCAEHARIHDGDEPDDFIGMDTEDTCIPYDVDPFSDEVDSMYTHGVHALAHRKDVRDEGSECGSAYQSGPGADVDAVSISFSTEVQSHWETLRNVTETDLAERFANKGDPLTKYVKGLYGWIPRTENEVREARAYIELKCNQESCMLRNGVSFRVAGELASIESRILDIAMQKAVRAASTLVNNTLESLQASLSQHQEGFRRRVAQTHARIQDELGNRMRTIMNESKRFVYVPQTRRTRIAEVIGGFGVPRKDVRVVYARGLKVAGVSLRQGITQTVGFREPIHLILRSVARILHQYGTQAFEINVSKDSATRVLRSAQDGNLLINAARRILLEQKQRAKSESSNPLIVPIQVFADEAHMTTNGRHALTPVKIRVLHRHMDKDRFHEPTLVAYLPAVDVKIARSVIEQDGRARVHESKDSKNWRKELQSSLWHSVLAKCFERTLEANKVGLPLDWNGSSFLLIPVFYKLCMDMPMMTALSFTRSAVFSMRRTDSRPCQQCRVLGPLNDSSQEKIPQFWVTTEPLDYRRESDILRFVKEDYGAYGEKIRKQESIAFLGEPVAESWNRFDDEPEDAESRKELDNYSERIPRLGRGRFQLCGADPLHAFLGFWLRGVAVAAVKSLLSKPDTRADVEKIDTVFQTMQERYRHRQGVHPAEGSRLPELQKPVFSLDHVDSDVLDSDDSNPSSSDSEFTTRINQKAPRKRKRKTSQVDSSVDATVSKTAVSKRKGSPTDQLRAIIDSAAGRRWKAIVLKIDEERIYRRNAVYVVMRASGADGFLSDLTKFAEQSYSLGILLQTLVLVRQESELAATARESFLKLGVDCVLMYSLLYKTYLSSTDVDQVRKRALALQRNLHAFRSTVGLPWNAPKIHAIAHFADSIADLGPVRFWDTCDGEKSFQRDKRWFATLAGTDMRNPLPAMMDRAEKHEQTDSVLYWIRNPDSAGSSAELEDESEETRERRIPWTRFDGAKQDSLLKLLGKGASFRFPCTRGGHELLTESFASVNSLWPPEGWDSTFDKEVWTRIDEQLREFIRCKYAESKVSVRIQIYRQLRLLVNRTVTVDWIVASPVHYGNPRWDFIEFLDVPSESHEYVYGKSLMVLEILAAQIYSGDGTERRTDSHTHTVVVIQRFRGNACSDSCRNPLKPCSSLDPVFLHRELDPLAVQVVEVVRVTGKVSAFLDSTIASGLWYYILNPSTFEGVLSYN